jgi:hypothetical protein
MTLTHGGIFLTSPLERTVPRTAASPRIALLADGECSQHEVQHNMRTTSAPRCESMVNYCLKAMLQNWAVAI